MLRTHVIVFLALATSGSSVFAQTTEKILPNPYTMTENWAKLPEGRSWGEIAAISIDSNGHLWIFERCGSDTCAGRGEAPILEFDPSGKLLRSFGAGMFVFPHGIFVDRDNNVWVADGDGKDGKGHQVFKFSPDGKVLLTLGKAGVAGAGPDTFNRPVGVVTAPNGDIFVADGHGGESNARIMKFSKDGKFVKTWGKKGAAPGEFGGLHSITMDSRGRVLVADRGNDRIQIFDQDGKFLDEWKQFGRPSSIFIDKQDRIFVPDIGSGKRGIRIGSAKDGSIEAFVPDPDQDPKHTGLGVADMVTDTTGTVYAVDTQRQLTKKLVKK